ncbi:MULTISPECIES: AI-2E family transporter [unclassified Gordonia (in: high G+C Gram-positive bacteria)]|uniref:AI-2E family transporter n=1 Tax=unclassified Gordonia (in: high G+C Gram-positive bacteria) TaxID=2657482 RepID=UPI001F0CF90A|nr:AI-2E family transporter [Gordonia sp. ABSL49_1]MCH5643698.1 AI-2E family transporter [Gordonia sp. ABSL49_1]
MVARHKSEKSASAAPVSARSPESQRLDPPSWTLPRGTIVLLTIAGMVVAIGGIKAVSGLVGPIFLALMLTVAVQPVPVWLRRKGWPRWASFLVTVLLVYGILITLFASLAFSLARLATILPTYSAKFDDLIKQFQSFLTDHGVSQDKVHQMLSNTDSSKVVSVVGDLLSSTLNVTSALVLVLALLLFMSADAVGYDDKMAELNRTRPDIASAFSSFSRGTRSYLVVTTVFGLIVAVLDTGALALMSVPLPVLWGLLSFITNYIPNIGFVIGVIPPALLALLDGGWDKMLWVIVVYSAINVIIQSVIQPKFVGDAVGLSTTLTFVSLMFWAWVIGPLGAILAVPLTLMAKALLIDIDPATKWADVLLSSSASGKKDTEPDADGDAPDGDSPGEAESVAVAKSDGPDDSGPTPEAAPAPS